MNCYQTWRANGVIRMKVAVLTEGLQGQTGGEKDQKGRKRPKYVVVQVNTSSLKVSWYPPVSITVSLQARTAPNTAGTLIWGTWSGDKLVSVYVCQVRNCALKPLSKHVKQWGRVCILCKGCRAGRPGSLTAAHLGCNGNCLASHLPKVVLSCCSLRCPNKANVSGSSGVVFVLVELGQTLKERTKFLA